MQNAVRFKQEKLVHRGFIEEELDKSYKKTTKSRESEYMKELVKKRFVTLREAELIENRKNDPKKKAFFKKEIVSRIVNLDKRQIGGFISKQFKNNDKQDRYLKYCEVMGEDIAESFRKLKGVKCNFEEAKHSLIFCEGKRESILERLKGVCEHKAKKSLNKVKSKVKEMLDKETVIRKKVSDENILEEALRFDLREIGFFKRRIIYLKNRKPEKMLPQLKKMYSNCENRGSDNLFEEILEKGEDFKVNFRIEETVTKSPDWNGIEEVISGTIREVENFNFTELRLKCLTYKSYRKKKGREFFERLRKTPELFDDLREEKKWRFKSEKQRNKKMAAGTRAGKGKSSGANKRIEFASSKSILEEFGFWRDIKEINFKLIKKKLDNLEDEINSFFKGID